MIFFSHDCKLRRSRQSYKKIQSEPKPNLVEYFLMINEYKNLKNACMY
jgi:hypothetical protein